MAIAVSAAAKVKNFDNPNKLESGAAIAKPIGRNNKDPIASNEVTLDKASREL